MIVLDEEVLISICGSDSIYSLSKDFDLIAVAAIGSEQSSIKSINFQEFRSNLYKLGDNYSPDDYSIMIPEGEFVHFEDLYIISLVRNIRQILWNRTTNRTCIATPEVLEYPHLLFENAYINILAYKNGYYFTSTKLDGHFYDEAADYIGKYDNPIAKTISAFISQYPEELIHENPILVKFSLHSVPFE